MKALDQLYCLDLEKMGLELSGSMWKDLNVLSLGIVIIPCASSFEDSDGVVHGGGEDCLWDQQEVESYL